MFLDLEVLTKGLLHGLMVEILLLMESQMLIREEQEKLTLVMRITT